MESPVECNETSIYNKNQVLIEVPYDPVLQDIQIPMSESCTKMPFHNSGIMESIANNVEITPAKTLNSNPEYQEPMKSVVNGRKQGYSINKKKEKQFNRHVITSDWVFANNCTHTNNNKKSGCQVSKLSLEDINAFRNNLSQITKKIDQDIFILTMLSIARPKQTDHHKSERKKRNVIKYYIPNEVGDKIPVCLKIF